MFLDANSSWDCQDSDDILNVKFGQLDANPQSNWICILIIILLCCSETNQISITRCDCIFACNALNLTFLSGNERRDSGDSNDVQINKKDWNGAILHANWIDIQIF